MKKVLLCLISVFALVICFILLSWCETTKKSKEYIINLIEEEIDVVIPSEFEIEEQYSSNIFMHGRLPNYYIFKASSEPTSFLSDYSFIKNENKPIEEDINDRMIKENEAYNLRIPKSSLIDFSKEYLLVYKKNNYFLVYYVDTCELIVYIEAN